MQNRMIYGMAILFSLVIYLFFVMPLDFSQLLLTDTLMKVGILIVILVFPMLLAWLKITRGNRVFMFALPFHLIGLFFLHRGLYLEGQIVVFKYSFKEYGSSLVGIENFILYLAISLLGLIIALVFLEPNQR
ncbi:hypothetical protein H1D32_02700 [Anaerobacillus sp. CMMVII]|uniref:hypothetical protein n=1 Tax=Anaerobacillus sp. CMMVII TaxID=2755588 RepID=UPI0021B71F1B|nr:hypothetical protein [Anaerobacillus sp. CMMVII]MCT8136758.1 hypothetical protein [Anaerobacillus sp. CMMVII]